MTDSGYRRWTAFALIAGPALFLLDNLIHPEELGRGNEAAQLVAIAESADRWQIAHLIGFISLILIVGAIVGLGRFVWESKPRLGAVGAALGIVGAMGLAFAFALDGFTWGTLGELSNRPELDDATLATALDEIQNSSWNIPYYALAASFLAGMLTLAWGAAPRIGLRAASLLGFGAVLVALEGLVADNAYFIASSAVFLLGGIDTGISIARGVSSDDEVPI